MVHTEIDGSKTTRERETKGGVECTLYLQLGFLLSYFLLTDQGDANNQEPFQLEFLPIFHQPVSFVLHTTCNKSKK